MQFRYQFSLRFLFCLTLVMSLAIFICQRYFAGIIASALVISMILFAFGGLIISWGTILLLLIWEEETDLSKRDNLIRGRRMVVAGVGCCIPLSFCLIFLIVYAEFWS